VYQDRLVNDEDRQWFEDLLGTKMEQDFGLDIKEIITQNPYIFGDFLSPNMGNRSYAYIEDHSKVRGDVFIKKIF
jgi:dynein heavy chain